MSVYIVRSVCVCVLPRDPDSNIISRKSSGGESGLLPGEAHSERALDRHGEFRVSAQTMRAV